MTAHGARWDLSKGGAQFVVTLNMFERNVKNAPVDETYQNEGNDKE